MIDLRESLKTLYPNEYDQALNAIEKLIATQSPKNILRNKFSDQNDVLVITYGDSIIKKGEKPLKTLNTFLDKYVYPSINSVHILPMFPYSSDDGFSVIDYEKVNPDLGSWDDIHVLSKHYDLMFDAVINHISQESNWFKKYQADDPKYKNYFKKCYKERDYHQVIRPRALPLYYAYETAHGKELLWATFSKDQLDLNYENYHVLIHVLKVLATYAKKGARFIRFDAVGFLWKDEKTSSMHLPQTHTIVKIMRYVLDRMYPGTIIITETNVPHEENVSYFGDHNDEAHMVYQFPLPPLTLFSFMSGNAKKLSLWADQLKNTKLQSENTYFNFLASHDGIGMRPVENILTPDEKQLMVDRVIENNGRIGYKNNPDGSVSPYELNINYFDAISSKQDLKQLNIDKFIAAHMILLSMKGMPAIYIHSLLGSHNDLEGLMSSGINRRINREKLDLDKLELALKDKTSDRYIILNRLLKLIDIRKNYDAFDPKSEQNVLFIDDRVFALSRQGKDTNIDVFINVSKEDVYLKEVIGLDVISENNVNGLLLKAYQFAWIKK